MIEKQIPEPILSLLHKAKIIFWDFDGVIKDSLEVKSKAFVDIFRGVAQDSILNKIEKHHLENGGISRKEKIPLYLNWSGIEADGTNIQKYLDKFASQVVQGVIECPYFEDVYQYLNQNHERQNFVIVTATPHEEIEVILKKLEIRSYFNRVYGHPITKEEGVTRELDTNSLTPQDCLFIGDSEKDYNASLNTSVPFLLKVHKTNQTLAERLSCPRF